MTLSVGFGRIVNDPEAPIRTRKALGRLATPGLLVTDQGLTIDTNGRMVLRLASGAGLSEDSNGLAVKLAPGGGLSSSSDGIAFDGELSDFGDITCHSITVDTNAIVTGNVAIGGVLSSAAVDTGELTVSGNADVTGTLNAGGLGTADLVVSGNASVGGTLTAGVFNPASISTGAIDCTTLTASSSATAAGSVGVGTTTLTAKLNVLATTEQQRLLYDASNYLKTTVASNGATTIQSVGTAAPITLVPASGRLNITGDTVVSNEMAAVKISVNGGTVIIRVLSFFVNVFLGHGAGAPNVPDDQFFTLSGAVFGDQCICSPLGIPGDNIAGWSAAIYAADACVIRIAKSESFGSTASMDFRVTVIGFS